MVLPRPMELFGSNIILNTMSVKWREELEAKPKMKEPQHKICQRAWSKTFNSLPSKISKT